VYAEAGITSPAHGYGVDKVAEMLANPHLGSRPRDVRATAALAALEAAQVPLRDVIDDAVLRHKALAAFEAAKALEVQAVKTRSRARIDALQEQVRVFLAARNGEIDTLNRAVQAARQQLAQLQSRKQREEDRLLRVVTHFVEPRPIPAPPSRGAIVSPLLPADPALRPAPPVPPAAPRPAPEAPKPPAVPAPAAPAAAPGPPGPPGPPKPGSA
jgi:TolA-binding protein